jgi:thymidine phosphorylase
LGNRTEIDHSVGVVLEKVAGDRISKGQVWANVHHSSKTSDLPLRLQDMMDSALVLEDLETEKESLFEQKHQVLKTGEKFYVRPRGSKVLRIFMEDEEV